MSASIDYLNIFLKQIGEFRRLTGQSVVPRISREMRTWGP